MNACIYKWGVGILAPPLKAHCNWALASEENLLAPQTNCEIVSGTDLITLAKHFVSTPPQESPPPSIPINLDWRPIPYGPSGYTIVPPRPSLKSLYLAGVLFLLTLCTCLVAGTQFALAYAQNQAVSFDEFLSAFTLFYKHPPALAAGLPFALTLLTILLAHACSCCTPVAAPPGLGSSLLRSTSCLSPSWTAATFCARSMLAFIITCLCFFPWLSCRSAYLVSGKVGTFGDCSFSACVSFASRPFTIPLRSTRFAAGQRFLRFLSFSSVSCPRPSTFLQILIDRFESPVMMPSSRARTYAPANSCPNSFARFAFAIFFFSSSAPSFAPASFELPAPSPPKLEAPSAPRFWFGLPEEGS